MDEILVVDDSIMNQLALNDILKDEFKIHSVSSGKAMFDMLEKVSPKLIILDIVMPDWDGFQVIEKLKASEDYKKIPVIFITGLNDAKSEAKGFELGAIDYIAKPFKENVVKARVRSYVQLYEFIRHAEDLSQKDGLSGLYNKKTTEEFIKENLKKVSNGALMIIDVDNFKSINDTFGHLYGDMVIKQLAGELKTVFQKSDVLGRVGGDEFFVFLRNYNDKSILEARANDICNAFRKTYQHQGQVVKISSSIGIATTDDSWEFEEMYKKADVALYATKARGKNGFSFYDGDNEIAYVSNRTKIENSKHSSGDARDNLKAFKQDLDEYVFNLSEEAKVSEYTIQSLLGILCEKFNFKRSYVSKFDYDERAIKCIYNWENNKEAPNPKPQEISLKTLTEMFMSFENDNFYISNPGEHKFKFSIDQDDNSTICAFALKNKTILLGHIAFEYSSENEPLASKIIEDIADVCQQLATIIVYRFLLEAATAEKDGIFEIFDNLPDPVYVAKVDRVNPIYINKAAKELQVKLHGANCFKSGKDGKVSCEGCPLQKAIAFNGIYEDNKHWCKEITLPTGGKAYIIKVK